MLSDPTLKACMPSSVFQLGGAGGRPDCDYLGNKIVYLMHSARAGGLSLGINMNPDMHCNFDCVYCDVNPKGREIPPAKEGSRGVGARIPPGLLAEELGKTLDLVCSGDIAKLPAYRGLSPELLKLRQMALSGDGEPTICSNFSEVVLSVIHVRAVCGWPFHKCVLMTNASALDAPDVQLGLSYFTRLDEIWVKLDVGTQKDMDLINRASVRLEKVLSNILLVALERPVIIQSLFHKLGGECMKEDQIDAYARRLLELKQQGAKISFVQIYSATRPAHRPDCEHLSLRELRQIATKVRQVTGLRVEVF